MADGWTPERRARQAELIRQWRPSEENTGPKSPEGKATSAYNVWKGGVEPLMRYLARLLRQQDKVRRQQQD
jgi:hypothetical protein